MRRDALLLGEITEAAERIVELTTGRSSSYFETNRDHREALLWNFTVLGEAVSQLSEELKQDYPQVGWADPVRTRNRIVHGYWSVDLDVLVAAADNDLPGLIRDLRSVQTDLG